MEREQVSQDHEVDGEVAHEAQAVAGLVPGAGGSKAVYESANKR